MAYQIHRVEKAKNREGHDEIFVQISYTVEKTGNVIPYAKWLSPVEQEQYLKDKEVLESKLIPEWLPFATAQYNEAKAAEEASKLTTEKVIAALIDGNVMSKVSVGKFTRKQVEALEITAKAISQDKVDAVIDVAS